MGKRAKLTATLPSRAMLFVMAIVLTVGGLLCLFNPVASTVTALVLAGGAFLCSGTLQGWMAWRNEDAPRNTRILQGLLGAVLVFFAVSLLHHPLAGIISLTVLVACLFLASGVVRVLVGLQMRPAFGSTFLLVSGLVSIGLAVLVFLNMPEIAAGLLGMLLGVDLLSAGLSTFILALGLGALRK